MNWWHRLLRRKAMEEQLDKELRFHTDQYVAELMARGYTSEDAARRARLDLGGPGQVKEECRDARGTRWVEDFWRDMQFALRMLRQKPGFWRVRWKACGQPSRRLWRPRWASCWQPRC